MPTITSLIGISLSALLALPVLAFAVAGDVNAACQQRAVTQTGISSTSGPSGGWTVASSSTSTTSGDAADEPSASSVETPEWDGEQLANAGTIVAVGKDLKVPPWGWIVAVATAIQESRLRNLPGGDRDSVGLFQQRPSAGWGTPAQLTSPTYQAKKFYTALLAIPGWQRLPLTEAAQAVQLSDFPGAYAKWTPAASQLVAHVASGSPGAAPRDLHQFANDPTCDLGGDGRPTAGDVPLPTGFTLPSGTPPPVATAIGWALAQLGTPYSYGGDCTDAHSGIAARQCDCSSLVQMAYRSASIPLPRTTTTQVLTGTAVPDLSQIRPGDLVFIPGSDGTPRAPGHVALYIGTGLAVHAPKRGEVVRLVIVANWGPMIASIRRPVP